MKKKLEIPDLSKEYKFPSYASEYTVDDLLDIFNMVKWDKDKEKSVEKILRIKTQKENKNNVESINLHSILLDFNQSDYKKRLLKVGDPTPEFTFVDEISEYIVKVLDWIELEDKERAFLEEIWIDVNNKASLKNLKKELESYITSFFEEKGISESNEYFEKKEADILKDTKPLVMYETWDNYVPIDTKNMRIINHKKNIKWKIIKPQHWAFNDGSGSEKYCPLVMYEIWDEYVPISNSCVWEIWKIDPNKNPDPSFDMLSSYSNRDRFTVVKPTYSEYIKYDRERIKCWFVNVRSKKTWKVYRVLSR